MYWPSKSNLYVHVRDGWVTLIEALAILNILKMSESPVIPVIHVTKLDR